MGLPSTSTDRDDALGFLLGRINYERSATMPDRLRGLKLDRMRSLLELLGNPHESLRAVHIAGTKGKGSTAHMLAGVLGAAGLRTGLYTSPHLEHLGERIIVDGQPCTNDELAALMAAVQPAVERLDRQDESGGLTFFEIVTAMAFVHFAQRSVDVAVLEVGLGGRLDSTNVCRPLVSVITSISFDHMKQLGNSLAAIAGEKAGIIKPKVPVISGVTEPEPRTVIEQIAAEQRAPLFRLERDFFFDYESRADNDSRLLPGELHYREPTYSLANVRLGMVGRHQAQNGAVSLAAIQRLREAGWNIPDAAVRRGLAEARCPARVEVVRDRPLTILDAAHNPASVQALLDAIDSWPARRRVLIFAASRDKDAREMLRRLLPRFDRVVLTQFVKNPRALQPSEELLPLVRDVLAAGGGDPEITVHDEPVSAWQTALAATSPDDLICISGSFFLAAEVRPLIVAADR